MFRRLLVVLCIETFELSSVQIPCRLTLNRPFPSSHHWHRRIDDEYLQFRHLSMSKSRMVCFLDRRPYSVDDIILRCMTQTSSILQLDQEGGFKSLLPSNKRRTNFCVSRNILFSRDWIRLLAIRKYNDVVDTTLVNPDICMSWMMPI